MSTCAPSICQSPMGEHVAVPPERVLFVDDETHVLDGIQRTLRKHVAIHTASSGAEGLRLLQEAGPFSLVISDMRMPGMNGAQFLSTVRDQAPDTVRMILSGQADLPSTIAAVNDGHIFRFLCKPCPADKLLGAVEEGLKQYRLITAEKVLLEQTLSGAIKMLIEILGMVSPGASSRASRLQRYVQELAIALQLPVRWQWITAAYVSQIGCVTLPKEIMAKVEAAQPLSHDEKQLYESHPRIAGTLLSTIPRLEDIAAIVTAQFGAIDVAEQPAQMHLWDLRTTGAMLLRVSSVFDRLLSHGESHIDAIHAIRALKLGAPESVLQALHLMKVTSREFTVRPIGVKDLAIGMILDEDLKSCKGIRLVPAGQEITRTLMVKLASIVDGVGVAEPFRVRIQA